MASVNKVILVGNLGRDPEVRYTPDTNLAICNLALATSSQWRDKNSGERREETEWHRVVLYGRQAEVAQEYLRKGRSVYIEGRLKTRKWQDKETGADRYSTEVIADQMQMLGGRDSNADSEFNQTPPRQAAARRAPAPAAAAQPTPMSSASSPDMSDMEDDIPF